MIGAAIIMTGILTGLVLSVIIIRTAQRHVNRDW